MRVFSGGRGGFFPVGRVKDRLNEKFYRLNMSNKIS